MNVSYHSKLYRDFRAINPGEWRTVVRFYEEFEKDIVQLEFEEYFELLTAYTNALFETGAYQKHLLMADVLIEISVMNNVKFFHGEDVFHKTLFRKAASCFHLHQLGKADHILRELLRIAPHDHDAAMFLKKCLRKSSPAYLQQVRAVAIFLFLVSALMISLELLVVRSFYPMYIDMVESSRNTLFLLGCGLLVGGDLFHRWRSKHEVDVFVNRIKRQKKKAGKRSEENTAGR